MARDTRINTIHLLRECHDICLETFAVHCVKEGGYHMAREHIRRMLSCIDMCHLTANFLLRHAPLVDELCELCAHLCEQCATSCNAMDDPHMRRCAQLCKETAQACLNESHHLKALAA